MATDHRAHDREIATVARRLVGNLTDDQVKRLNRGGTYVTHVNAADVRRLIRAVNDRPPRT